ncbi:diguanylate cyclase [Paucidesulfovibrio longus]|uniref:diguanylate cyclase n=1 Tax=Paucidesulfovibrio longus TaxID=889 RepID=UPI0003B2E8C7|nr:diguanylate cyclase [Paucidesulfovibrio longus]
MTKDRILIVEDSTFFASIVKRAISEETGFAVDRVGSFKEAREYLENCEQGPFAALLDLHLPDSPHGEVVDYFVGKGVPSIVFTGEFSEGVRDVVMSKNVVDYVLKEGPDSLYELIAALERLRRNQEVKVLVVDDSGSARNLVAGLLRSHQYQVLEAEDGETALTVLQRNPGTKLLITDFSMPGMDGVELVKTVRAAHVREKLAIIGLSAENNPLISARFIKSGANDFLRKPFLVEEFHCRIRQNMELLEHMATIRDMAEKDYLTGLHNRRHFIQRARTMHKEALLRKFPVQAVLLDIDHFKRINDTYGHDAGDEVLRALGRKMHERFGRNGLVARYGGEEFALLLPGLPLEQTTKNLTAFLKEVESSPTMTKSGPVSCTVSAGLTGETGDSLEAMLKTADEQLYKSKQRGRNCLSCAED